MHAQSPEEDPCIRLGVVGMPAELGEVQELQPDTWVLTVPSPKDASDCGRIQSTIALEARNRAGKNQNPCVIGDCAPQTAPCTLNMVTHVVPYLCDNLSDVATGEITTLAHAVEAGDLGA